MRADIKRAKVSMEIPVHHRRSSTVSESFSSLSPASSAEAFLSASSSSLPLTCCADIIVQVAMPTLIMITERYLVAVYRLLSRIMPRIMLAIMEPWRLKKVSSISPIDTNIRTYRPEYHVERHRYVEVERVVVGHADDKVHDHQSCP